MHNQDSEIPLELIDLAVLRFSQIRMAISERIPGYLPSIREFLDWVKLLTRHPDTAIKMLRDDQPIPYPQVLFKLGLYQYLDDLLSGEPPPLPNQDYRVMLLQKMSETFNQEAFDTLCFYIGVNVDIFAGHGLESKMRELILNLNRRSRLTVLIDYLTEVRPNVDWNHL